MNGQNEVNELERLKSMARRIRRRILDMSYSAGSSGAHLGGALSIVELLSVLYGSVLRYDAKNPDWEERDRFILSKGHTGLALYAALAEVGILSSEEIDSFQKNESNFTTHPIINRKKGIEFSTGSLGMGLSLGLGVALAAKMRSQKYCIFVCLGDGECNEGSVWESAMAAANFQLDNLIAIVDKNALQASGKTNKIMNNDNIEVKWNSFGWNVINSNGNDIEQLLHAFDKYIPNNKPYVFILETIKGYGFTFSENNASWHHGVMSKSQYDAAVAEFENHK
ncbi:MAG: transketolase [Planctomycetaceae bacterium]|jgi:transketolase|nr:transketolase [Planctomycetaceae bacterium]